jgi:hypothetical protein
MDPVKVVPMVPTRNVTKKIFYCAVAVLFVDLFFPTPWRRDGVDRATATM